MEKKEQALTLITVLGSTPAVITETLYALRNQKIFPDRIVVFTTSHGAQQLKEKSVYDVITQLSVDYNLTPPTLNDDDIHVVTDSQGEPLNDIRNHADQESMADYLTNEIRKLTKDTNVDIHASIAGGRKSMSFYMGYIFSMFARANDKLSHVLVEPEYETGDFWYPTEYSKPILIKNHKINEFEHKTIIDPLTQQQRVLDAKDATVELAEIPFIRFNDQMMLNEQPIISSASYRETIAMYQCSLFTDTIRLSFDTKNHVVKLNGKELTLPIESYVFYLLVAEMSVKDDLKYKRSQCEDMESDYISALAKVAQVNVGKDEKLIDKLDEIHDALEMLGYQYNPKMYKSIEDKGLNTTLTDRFSGDIENAIKHVAVNNTVELCKINIVKNESADNDGEYKADYREKTKGGFFGLRLNPNQITVE